MNTVQLYKKYQCPLCCKVDHDHFVYYADKVENKNVMTIIKK